MSVDRILLRWAARNVEESPEYLPFSGVRIIVGQEENGTQLVYEAGDMSWRVLEIENPWGTQTMANNILAQVQGYAYKPYKATGAILNPAAELGDAVSVAGVYSLIAESETQLTPLMSATISAPEDSVIDHEYPYESRSTREVSRKINGVKTSLTVELGRIVAEISETYETKSDAGTKFQQLSSSITQTATGITQAVSATYETKAAAAQKLADAIGYTDSTKVTLEATISLTAAGITQSVSETYETKSAADAQYTALQSSITQTATSITQTVSATYATKTALSTVEQTATKINWLVQSGTSASNFTLTPRAIKLVSDTINLTGYVTFTSLSTFGESYIDGGNINTDNLMVTTIYAKNNYGLYYTILQTSYSDGGLITLGGRNTLSADYNHVEINANKDVKIAYHTGSYYYYVQFSTKDRTIEPNSASGANAEWSLGTNTAPFGSFYTKGLTVVSQTGGADVTICSGSGYADKLAFFGHAANVRQTLITTGTNMDYTSATADNYLNVLNNLVGILMKKYGLIA